MNGIDSQRFLRLFGISLAIVAVWIIFAIFSASDFHSRNATMQGRGGWESTLCFQLMSGLVWAVFTPLVIAVTERLPVQPPNLARNLAGLLVITPAMAVIRAAGGGVLHQLLFGDQVTWSFVMLSIALRFGRWWLLILVIALITNLAIAMKESAARERRALSTQAQAAAVELQSLRDRVQPRFVFAMLDAIKRHLPAHPAAADRMLVALSDLLRQTLEYGRRDDVTLADELELVDCYVELERNRSGGSLESRFTVEEDVFTARIPPLLFQTLVDSAVVGRHDVEERLLDIRGRSSQGRLTLDVQCRPALAGNGRAIEQMSQRLRQMFASDYAIRAEHDGSSTRIAIDIPLRSMPQRKTA